MKNYCKPETMSLKDISDALTNKNMDNNQSRIVVPRFQRGKRWKMDQKKTFVDSIKNGFPVGSLLFYQRVNNNKIEYVVVDGLQRCSCISDYIHNPYEFMTEDEIPKDIYTKYSTLVNRDSNIVKTTFLEITKEIKNAIPSEFIGRLRTSLNIEDNSTLLDELRIVEEYLKGISEDVKAFEEAKIPVIIYSGEESNLHIIFERINSKGTPLIPYEIYAASWPDRKYYIESTEVLTYLQSRDIKLAQDGIILDEKGHEDYMVSQKISAFEYLFAFSKYIANKYSILGFYRNKKADEINPIGFMLLDACLHTSNKIPVLYQDLASLEINELQKAIENSIEYIRDSIKVVSEFKGNNRGKSKIFHSQYQIMSMVADAFLSRYEIRDGKIIEQTDWKVNSKDLKDKYLQYYIHDIIERTWFDGGTHKIYSFVHSKRYHSSISKDEWVRLLDNYYKKSLETKKQKDFKGPSNDDYVILNTIYMNIFTYAETEGQKKYDVEHIAPKEQMKKIMKKCNSVGLHVESIANLCYLEERLNRVKQEKNFYQDEKFPCDGYTMEKVEKTYSFTTREDLSWMDNNYEVPGGDVQLAKDYTKFTNKRFEILKKKFLESLGFEYEIVEK